PYMLVEGNPLRVWSINKVGLRRREISGASIEALKEAHRLLFRSRAARKDLYSVIEQRYHSVPEIRALVEFMRATEGGNQGRARQP
ncbi:MAG: acyl-ACP--UDP-N-acetylglucosamine O-acyltransferase, partial [Anaerolineales bacterium]